MAGKKGMKYYAVEMKLAAVRMFYEEGKSRAEITATLGIRDPHRVKMWLKQYRREGAESFANKRRGRPLKQESMRSYIARLEMENGLLKKYHTELRNEVLAKRNIGSSTTTERNTK